MKPSPKTHTGFTLVELMIVVAIIAILAALAYVNYSRYIVQSRRTDATSALAQYQGVLERCYAQTFSYLNVQTGANNCATLGANVPSPGGYYNVAVAVPLATSYTLTATAATGSPQSSDTACSSFIVNSAPAGGTPVRQVLNSAGVDNTAVCWPQ